MEGISVMKGKTNKTTVLKAAAWIAGLALLVWCGVSFAETVRRCAEMEKNPPGFVDSMIYMSIKGKELILTGVWTTVRIALLGTAIAFVLANLVVFLRIQEPNRRDMEGTQSSVPTPQTGQHQSSGISANAVPGAMPLSGSPSAGS